MSGSVDTSCETATESGKPSMPATNTPRPSKPGPLERRRSSMDARTKASASGTQSSSIGLEESAKKDIQPNLSIQAKARSFEVIRNLVALRILPACAMPVSEADAVEADKKPIGKQPAGKKPEAAGAKAGKGAPAVASAKDKAASNKTNAVVAVKEAPAVSLEDEARQFLPKQQDGRCHWQIPADPR